MTAIELQAKLQNQAHIIILDVRESFELEICKLNGSIHIPMGLIPAKFVSLPKDQEIVVLCHHGIRSLQVANFLTQNGFQHIHNLDGGIHAWSQLVDKNMPTY